jgi:REP element-mobilizing transposase RayT
MLFRNRNYLPHLECPSGTYFVTFRLAGSVPQDVMESWKAERREIQRIASVQKRQLSSHEKQTLKYLYSSKVQHYLDQSIGVCWLKHPVIAKAVNDALLYFDCERYRLHAWCIMPNHVHVVFTVVSGNMGHSDLIPILHSWKSFTAHQANKALGRSGTFWQNEYYDHLIRNDKDFGHCVEYTLQNPVKAGLCKQWNEWKWSGCSVKIRKLLSQ